MPSSQITSQESIDSMSRDMKKALLKQEKNSKENEFLKVEVNSLARKLKETSVCF